MTAPLRIISLGWGVQSFALAAMSALGELPGTRFAWSDVWKAKGEMKDE